MLAWKGSKSLPQLKFSIHFFLFSFTSSSKICRDFFGKSTYASACISETILEETTNDEGSVAATRATVIETVQEIEESTESTDHQASISSKSNIPKEEEGATTRDTKVEEQTTESEETVAEKTVDESAVNLEVQKQRCREDNEKLFTASALEKLLGLLGTILPRNSKVSFRGHGHDDQDRQFQPNLLRENG